MTDRAKRRLVFAAGGCIVLLALVAAVLPMYDRVVDRNIIGTLLVVAGLIELVAALVSPSHRPAMSLASVATVAAGTRLLVDPDAGFFPVLNLVILWLIVRTAALAFAAWRSDEPVKSWLIFSGSVDFLLAIGLLAGLPIAFLVVGVFGPTQPIVSTFAWVFALSFVTTGASLIALSRLEFPTASN